MQGMEVLTQAMLSVERVGDYCFPPAKRGHRGQHDPYDPHVTPLYNCLLCVWLWGKGGGMGWGGSSATFLEMYHEKEKRHSSGSKRKAFYFPQYILVFIKLWK